MGKSRATQVSGKAASGRAAILQLFLDNLGRKVTGEEIREAVTQATGISDYENWHQRLSELRTDHGYTILSKRDRKDFRPGEYMMPTAERRAIAGKRVKPTKATWKTVLERAGHRCEWKEGGEPCNLHEGEQDPIGGGTVRLTSDHKTPHSVDPNSDPNDPDQWQALCGRHQVTKRNYWDSTTGKLNALAIVQAAPATEKRRIFKMLLDYHDYEIDPKGNIVKR